VEVEVPAQLEEEDDLLIDGAFDGSPPIVDGGELPTRADPEDTDEELELVYVQRLGCYYCPGNQQYYQLDEQ
jgi:hypothetical protein